MANPVPTIHSHTNTNNYQPPTHHQTLTPTPTLNPPSLPCSDGQPGPVRPRPGLRRNRSNRLPTPGQGDVHRSARSARRVSKRLNTHTHAHIHIHTRTHTHIHIHIHPQPHARSHAHRYHLPTHPHTNAYTRTHAHAHAHAHTHTHAHALINPLTHSPVHPGTLHWPTDWACTRSNWSWRT